jgi:COX assembly protein 2
MHPPLDRPHPDCEDVIAALKACHQDTWKKYTGGCNSIKFAMDQCFKQEKARLLKDLTKDLPSERRYAEEIVKDAFGRKETFQDFLARDEDYQKAMKDKKKERS